jgi:glutaminyl-tRNA synthetase
VKNEAGEVVEVHCTYDPATRGGDAPDGRKVKATIHWVSAAHALECEARLYDKLMVDDDGEQEVEDFTQLLNPKSLEVVFPTYVEPSVAQAASGSLYQFERLAYFTVDPDSTPEKMVFNRTVQLRDSWAKIEKNQGKKA